MREPLQRLAERIARRPGRVLLGLLALGALSTAFGLPLLGELSFSSSDLEARGSQSVRTAATIERLTHEAPAPTVFALVRNDPTSTPAQVSSRVAGVAQALAALPGIAQVASFPQAALIEKITLRRYFFSRDGRWSFVAANVRAGVRRTARAAQLARRLLARFPPSSGVLLGGSTVADEQLGVATRGELAATERWLLPLLALLLLAIFRRPAAAALPLLIGLLTLAQALALLRLAHLAGAQISLLALPIASGLSLGLGVDYSLLGVTRFREEVAHGSSQREAARTMLGTAGRTVVFSAGTIACCMAALAFVPVPLVAATGLAVGLCACAAAANALLLLPAACVLWGSHLTAPPGLLRPRGVARGAWARLAELVTRRAAPVALASAAVLLALGAPALGLRFHGVDAGALPTGTGGRVAAEVVERDFEPAVGDEILSLLVRAPHTQRAAVEAFRHRVARMPGVRSVYREARAIGPDKWELNVVSRAPRLAPASLKLVKRVRTERTPFPVTVASPAASFLDQQATLAGQLPAIALALALGVCALVFAMTRSLVLPLKALALNGLTFAAAFGLVALLFQREPLTGLLADGGGGGLEVVQPIVMLGAVFGLSTDYNLFVLARIQEARRAGAGERAAIALGLQRSGPVVSAAALVFCVTVAAFATSAVEPVRETAAGMALAVAIDATLVRALLLPSAMALLGPYNWWLPEGLSRRLTPPAPEKGPRFSGTLDA